MKDLPSDSGKIKRLSQDSKATVNIGDYSRAGKTRGDNKAEDHDMGCDEKYILLPQQEQEICELIQIKIDNGPESSGVRTQFLNRMVALADDIGRSIQLLYYPPYHSKYNPIERCWGILEQHWNGAKLIDVDTLLVWAQSMTWKGIQPIITLSEKVYEKGISLSKKAMKQIEVRLERNPLLPKWDILIR